MLKGTSNVIGMFIGRGASMDGRCLLKNKRGLIMPIKVIETNIQNEFIRV